MENRHALAVNVRLTAATGLAELEAAVSMVEGIRGRHRITVGADKAYDTNDFVANMRDLGAAPHILQNTSNRRSAVDCRTTRHPCYAISQRVRKRIEEIFGWVKGADLRETRHRGTARVGSGRLDVHADSCLLQPDPPAKAAGGGIIPPESA